MDDLLSSIAPHRGRPRSRDALAPDKRALSLARGRCYKQRDMRFRLLGPLEIEDVADEALVRRTKPRALLAMLLLNANRPVSTERLVAGLWGDEEPATALGALQNYVSQLRKALGKDVVVTRAPGYMAVVAPGELDLEVFKRLVAEAAEADLPTRAARLREALALWRGPPLADLADEPFALFEIRRLNELRLAALVDRIAADLDLGGHGELIAELEALVQEEPLIERFRALLMLALYRGGRQVEALAVYRDARKQLDEDQGLEPGEALQQLERAILKHDPELDAPATTAARVAGMPTVRSGRRTVTVLFADVTGSTELGESLDPEALRDLMSTFFEEMRSAIERHGGTVEKFAGDEVMAVFGVPVAHEDDAVRAIRAADDMLTAVRALDEALERDRGVRFRLRIGINTGEAVSGQASAGGTFVTGSAVNVGKRLQALAEPGDAVLGEATLRLVRDAVEVEPLGPVVLRGKAEPLEAYRLLSVQADAPGVARAFDSPFVGRQDEIGALRLALDVARTERRCRLMALIGNAGIGKTRIAREFVESLEGARVLVGRCVPYGDGATYLPLVDALRDVLPELEQALEEDVMVRIAALVSGSETPATAGDTAWAVRRSFETLARERPLVVIFDDVHWAEPTFLDLVEYLGAWTDDAPILLLALARPDLLDERPTWADPEVGVATLRLGPLDGDDTRALVANLAGDSVDEDQRNRVVELAEGYPLFAEQLVAWIEEVGRGRRPRNRSGDHRSAACEPPRPPRRRRACRARARGSRRARVLAGCGDRPLASRRAGRGEPPPDVARAEGPRSTCAVRPSARGRTSLPSRPHPRRRVRRHPEVGARRPARAGRRLAGEASRRAERGRRLPPRAGARLSLRARASGPGRAEAWRRGRRTARARRCARSRPRRLEGRGEPSGPCDIAAAVRRGLPSRAAGRARRRVPARR